MTYPSPHKDRSTGFIWGDSYHTRYRNCGQTTAKIVGSKHSGRSRHRRFIFDKTGLSITTLASLIDLSLTAFAGEEAPSANFFHFL
jgi:hypothetical protein